MGQSKNIRKVAIIGGGPKGIYGFERLTAWLKIHPPSKRTEIHIFNRSHSFGAGENFSVEQPSYLLMNNPAGDLNMWSEEEPRPVVSQPSSFQKWLCHTAGMNISCDDYATRAMAGRYLSHGFYLIKSNMPENVEGKYIVGEVVDIYYESEKYSICLKADDDVNYLCYPDRFDHILLSTGHPKQRDTVHSLRYQSFAEEHENAGYIPFVYPVESVFSNVPPNCSVGIKGLGLTFVDALLALTEGKGGRFVRNENSDKLKYIPSGEEPKVIYPFSRSGLPMVPRRSIPNVNRSLIYFTRSALQRYPSGKKLNFEKQIWPLLKQDMIYAYYDLAIKNAGNSGGLSACVDFTDVEHLVADYHNENSSELDFNADKHLDPLLETDFHKGKTHNQYIKSIYADYLQEAQKGELRSPMAAVTAVWRKATSLFCELYSFGGLTPESHRNFDCSIRGKLNRVTYGPPVISGEKLYALIEFGMLNFNAARNPELVLDEKNGSYLLRSRPEYTNYPIQYLIDARIPKVNLTDGAGPLFRNLLNRGLISNYENRSGEESYLPGAVNITRQGFAIDKNGHTNRSIAVTGTPTEGITFDNDTLSRDRNNFVDGWAEFISEEYAKTTLEQYAI